MHAANSYGSLNLIYELLALTGNYPCDEPAEYNL
jgi:hypothetical protein